VLHMCSLIYKIQQADFLFVFVKAHCASRENQKRLQGIILLVIRKLSIAGTECLPANAYETPTIVIRTRSTNKRHPRAITSACSKSRESNDSHSGLRSLQRVVQLVDGSHK
jgi:hypothetical protein